MPDPRDPTPVRAVERGGAWVVVDKSGKKLDGPMAQGAAEARANEINAGWDRAKSERRSKGAPEITREAAYGVHDFNPRLHPRDREGQFREVLMGLGFAQSARLPSGTLVTRAGSYFQVRKPGQKGGTDLIHASPDAAASQALRMDTDHSARVEIFSPTAARAVAARLREMGKVSLASETERDHTLDTSGLSAQELSRLSKGLAQRGHHMTSADVHAVVDAREGREPQGSRGSRREAAMFVGPKFKGGREAEPSLRERALRQQWDDEDKKRKKGFKLPMPRPPIRVSLAEGRVVQGYGFDPDRHPRDRLGKFTDVLLKLTKAPKGSDVALPHGIRITRSFGSYEITQRGRRVGKSFRADTTAKRALEHYDEYRAGRTRSVRPMPGVQSNRVRAASSGRVSVLASKSAPALTSRAAKEVGS